MLKIGDVFEAEVHDLTSSGQGVLKHSGGMTVFASGVWIGECARFRVREIRKRYAQANVVQLLKESEYRRAAPCQYHGAVTEKNNNIKVDKCGGCAWMFVEYQAQLQAKSARVASAIERLNSKWIDKIKPILGSDQELGYRNRVQFKTDGQKLGFVAEQSNTIVSVDDCLVLEKTLRNALDGLVSTLPNNRWKPSKKQQWTTLDLDDDHGAEHISLNNRLPFKQGNTAQNKKMKNWLKNRLDKIAEHSDGQRKAVELFCGSGNFTEILVPYCERIIAAECSDDAIDTLRSHAWENVEAHVADLFNETKFSSFIQKCKGSDVLVLDPPRDGLKVFEGLFSKRVSPKHVLYVSCDLATFVRDLNVFSDNGYKLRELQPIDLFPNTPHIELMAHISK